jgi:phenylacetate-coenzyme A ligase PaaK-like adenylate-forming protein
VNVSTIDRTAASAPTPLAVWDEVTSRFCAGELAEEALHHWQQSQLRAVVSHMTARSVFYRERLGGLVPGSVSRETLPTLPFTTKQDLRAAQWDIACGTVADARVYYETTGTTGPTTPCPRSELDMRASNAHVIAAWQRALPLVSPRRRPVVALMGPAELYAFADTFSAVCAELGLCHAKLWPESPRVGFRKAIRLLRELRVNIVVCAPALCLSLARAALDLGYDPRHDFGIDAFFVLGEICTPEFGANVRSLWGAQVIPALYGSQECYSLAVGCPRGRLHMAETNYVTEVIDPGTLESQGASGHGELVVTMLLDGIKPLLRFRTGDLVSLGERRCECGSPGRVIEVLGRADDTVRIGAIRQSPRDLESAVLAEVSSCLGYQLVVGHQAGEDTLTVRLLLRAGRDPAAGHIRAAVHRRLAHLGIPVTVETVAAIDPITSTGAYVSWKAARIEDRRVPEDDTRRAARQAAQRHDITK